MFIFVFRIFKNNNKFFIYYCIFILRPFLKLFVIIFLIIYFQFYNYKYMGISFFLDIFFILVLFSFLTLFYTKITYDSNILFFWDY